jgi:hypothetical protein
MVSFKLYFEDFNNWRNPVNANQSGPDVANLDPSQSNTPAGFKGAQGSTWPGASQQVDIKIPKKKKSRFSELRKKLKLLKEKLNKLKRHTK